MADPKLIFIDSLNDIQSELDRPTLLALVKGRSINRLAISDQFFELELSDAFNLRIQSNYGLINLSLWSTLNEQERLPIRINLLETNESPTGVCFETRLHSLRQLYAISFLINANRAIEAAQALLLDRKLDLEVILLDQEERLLITDASRITFWVTLLTKTAAAFRSLLYLVPLFYNEGNRDLLEQIPRKMHRRKLDVRQRDLEIAERQIKLAMKIYNIKDPQLRDRLEKTLADHLNTLGKPLLLLQPGEM